VARIRARDEGVPALGYTIENRAIGAALWAPLAESQGFECFAPARLVRFQAAADCVTAEVESASGPTTVRAQLLIAADGQRSSVRQALGIATKEHRYAQSAIILNCMSEEPHRGRAFERFTPDGPLAVLPLTGGRVGVVWTLPAQMAQDMMALDDGDFREALQRAFGFRLGRFERVGRRALHDLSRSLSAELTAKRVVLIGNAAVSLHPVAGQGFNLAIRDIATLAELIADRAADDDGHSGIDTDALLSEYRQWRRRDQTSVAAFTHGLVRGFALEFPGAGTLRSLALLGFDLLPGAKRILARHTMGRAGRLPRLARGLGLR
jgi:2-octaprenyl-6-methoxyphenol hydroxylase